MEDWLKNPAGYQAQRDAAYLAMDNGGLSHGDAVLVLQQVREMVSLTLGPAFASTLRMSQRVDYLAKQIALDVEATVLSERIPTQTITDQANFTIPRFASWAEHFRATYRQRWWGRLLRLREPRFVDERVAHRIDVKVRDWWIFPNPPAAKLGRTVLRGDERPAWESSLQPWVRW